MIEGKKREVKDFVKSVGIFEAEVVIINPTTEQFKEVLDIELKEDSKATEYIGESKDGNVYLRLNVWLRNVKNGEIFQSPVSFFLEDKERDNKEGTKKQYINTVGVCTWADDENNLPDWFKEREYRVANVGEEELYNFLKTWLGKLDYRDAETILQIEWKKLMKNNVKDLSDQIGGEYACNIGVLATVVSREKENDDGIMETREYQGIYNKAFLPAYAIKHFRLVDYSNKDVIARISAKKPRDQKAHEKFVLSVINDYGCKDAYVLKDLIEYDAESFITGTDKVIDEKSAEY